MLLPLDYGREQRQAPFTKPRASGPESAADYSAPGGAGAKGTGVVTGSLVHQRCLQHPDREAAFRCPACKRNYCRECGVEHDGRMLCGACLKKLVASVEPESGRW